MRRVVVAAVAVVGLVVAGCGSEPETGSVAGSQEDGEQQPAANPDADADEGAAEGEADLPEPITGEEDRPPHLGNRDEWPEYRLAMAWVEAIHRAREDFDTSWAEELSLPGCVGCEHLIELANDLESNGGEFRGGRLSESHEFVSPRGSIERDEEVEFWLTLDREPYTLISEAGGEPEEFESTKDEHYFLMTVVDGEWKIKNYYIVDD